MNSLHELLLVSFLVHDLFQCCRSVIINKIIARQKDLVGVVLFGTNKDDPKTKTKHVNKLLDLNFPNADAVSLLDKLLSGK